MRTWLERTPLHTLFIAAYPVVALLANNLGQVHPRIATRALIVSILVGGVSLLALWGLVKDWRRAGLLASWGLLLFYSYGPVYNTLRPVELMGTIIGRHRFLLPAWAILGVAGVGFILRRPRAASWLTALLNLGVLFAIVIPAGQILASAAGSSVASGQGIAGGLAFDSLQMPLDGPAPDIYYIVLDAYGRADTLLEEFDIDNRPFLDDLKAMGFFVADCSQSNYGQTELSLASTLNMQYLSELIDESVAGEAGRAQLWPLIRHSAVRQLLEELGYRTVAFETGYYWTEWEDADLYLAPNGGVFGGMSAFEGTLLRSTAAWALIDALPVLPSFLSRDLDRSIESHRERLLYVFDQLESMSEIPGPKFVFAHIVSPHRPFVFDSEGDPVEDDYTWTHSNLGLDAYREGYREQLAYLNHRMEVILRAIVDGSDGRAVIILAGDHGPEEATADQRMRNLNVFFLGGKGSEMLAPTLSPVNSFRIVLSVLFGAELTPIPDVSYFSSYDAPFDYSIVANKCSV